LANDWVQSLFGDAIFTQNVAFSKSTFARFKRTTFRQGAYFDHATFAQDVNFSEANFEMTADFREAIFSEDTDLSEVTFKGDALFIEASFTRLPTFFRATFIEDALFARSKFFQKADFYKVTFTQKANFYKAMFSREVDFSDVAFNQAAHFQQTRFGGTLLLMGSRFLDAAEFRFTEFVPEDGGLPTAVFERSSFSNPGDIVFEEVDLSRALFHNCNVSEVLFTSSVQWGKRRRGDGVTVYEETIPLDHWLAKGMQQNGERERDYRAVAQIYQQLKKSYDTRLDYWTANKFPLRRNGNAAIGGAIGRGTAVVEAVVASPTQPSRLVPLCERLWKQLCEANAVAAGGADFVRRDVPTSRRGFAKELAWLQRNL
jgi:uncharacterized protein YjbI with pentapeptide repeats